MFALKFWEPKPEKSTVKIEQLPVDAIRPNPNQPRKFFDRQSLEELAASIKEFGVMQPINVRIINNDFYELISGERRLRASMLAGCREIPAIVVDASDNESALMALIENLQRQNLNFFEEAKGYESLMSDYGLTIEELAGRLGKSRSGIANKLRLLKLPKAAKNLILENGLSERHGRALLRIPDEKAQMRVLMEIINKDLNVSKAETLVEATVDGIRHGKRKLPEPPKHNRIIRKAGDSRVYTNTVLETVDIIRRWGVDATCDIEEKETFYEIKIKIPFA